MKMVVCVIFVVLLTSCSTTQRYYVKNAEMIPFSESDRGDLTGNRSEAVKHLLNGHYIRSGENLVLLIRKFDKGSTFAIDDESFEKLTIEIRKYTIGVPIALDSPDITLYYSRGGSGWIYKGQGVYSTSASGSLIIRRMERNRLIAEIDMTTWAEPAGEFPFKGREIHIRDVMSFTEKNVSGLTPWTGTPDGDVGHEVYPMTH